MHVFVKEPQTRCVC